MNASTFNNSLDMMQLEVFFKVLNIIEKNNIEWFVNRSGINKKQKHDILANHIKIISNEYGVLFTFKSKSELPFEIRYQCNRTHALLFPEIDWKDPHDINGWRKYVWNKIQKNVILETHHTKNADFFAKMVDSGAKRLIELQASMQILKWPLIIQTCWVTWRLCSKVWIKIRDQQTQTFYLTARYRTRPYEQQSHSIINWFRRKSITQAF